MDDAHDEHEAVTRMPHLVGTAFMSNPNKYKCIKHLIRNKQCNESWNLVWCACGVMQPKKYGSENHKSKPVMQKLSGKFINSFANIQEAARETGISKNSIYSACNGGMKQAGGFHWTYK